MDYQSFRDQYIKFSSEALRDFEEEGLERLFVSLGEKAEDLSDKEAKLIFLSYRVGFISGKMQGLETGMISLSRCS